jgi:thiamine biosynthesis protein ThiC
MTNKHTPGPWMVIEGTINPLPSDIYCYNVGAKSKNEAISNGQLISAAPELLEALKIAEAWISDTQLDFDLSDNGTLQEIRAAIAKAKGE